MMKFDVSLFAPEWDRFSQKVKWVYEVTWQREDEEPLGGSEEDGMLEGTTDNRIIPIKRARNQKKTSPMDAYCFSDTFNQLSSKNLLDLQHAFLEYGGKLPSRREIRSLGLKMGLSQSRIRKWFLERSNPSTVVPDVGGLMAGEANLLQKIEHIEVQMIGFQKKLEWLEAELKQSRACADSLAYFAPTWLFR